MFKVVIVKNEGQKSNVGKSKNLISGKVIRHKEGRLINVGGRTNTEVVDCKENDNGHKIVLVVRDGAPRTPQAYSKVLVVRIVRSVNGLSHKVKGNTTDIPISKTVVGDGIFPPNLYLPRKNVDKGLTDVRVHEGFQVVD